MTTTSSNSIPEEVQAWAATPEGRVAIEKWQASPAGDELRRRMAAWEASGQMAFRKPMGAESRAWLDFSPAGVAQRKAQLASLGSEKVGVTRRGLKAAADKVMDKIQAGR